MNTSRKHFHVYVDDNARYMDDSSRILHGVFDTYEEALCSCKVIVEDSIRELFDYSNTEEENYRLYQLYGLSPWFDPYDAGEKFSANDYARLHIQLLYKLKPFLD
jgi:hypothetical protein